MCDLSCNLLSQNTFVNFGRPRLDFLSHLAVNGRYVRFRSAGWWLNSDRRTALSRRHILTRLLKPGDFRQVKPIPHHRCYVQASVLRNSRIVGAGSRQHDVIAELMLHQRRISAAVIFPTRWGNRWITFFFFLEIIPSMAEKFPAHNMCRAFITPIISVLLKRRQLCMSAAAAYREAWKAR